MHSRTRTHKTKNEKRTNKEKDGGSLLRRYKQKWIEDFLQLKVALKKQVSAAVVFLLFPNDTSKMPLCWKKSSIHDFDLFFFCSSKEDIRVSREWGKEAWKKQNKYKIRMEGCNSRNHLKNVRWYQCVNERMMKRWECKVVEGVEGVGGSTGTVQSTKGADKTKCRWSAIGWVNKLYDERECGRRKRRGTTSKTRRKWEEVKRRKRMSTMLLSKRIATEYSCVWECVRMIEQLNGWMLFIN